MQIIIFAALIISAFVGGSLVADKGENLVSQITSFNKNEHTIKPAPTPTQKSEVRGTNTKKTIPTSTSSPKSPTKEVEQANQVNQNSQQPKYDGTRTGRIIKYKEFCAAGKEINIYENELITKVASDGKTYSWTREDWVCFEEFLETGKPPLPKLSPTNIFNLVNSYRSTNGKPQLILSQELCNLAQIRADFLISNDMEKFKTSETGAHTGFSDLPGYSGSGTGENLAGWVFTNQDTLEIWKESPAHNELLLWTEHSGTLITKGCVATRVEEYGSVVVLLVGDR